MSKKLSNYSENIDVNKEYLQLLKMVIKDNTNKQLIEKYLLFIKSNEEKLQSSFNDYYKTYETESKYYSILLDNTCQKQLFINLLTKIETEKIDEIYKLVQEELSQVRIFNQ